MESLALMAMVVILILTMVGSGLGLMLGRALSRADLSQSLILCFLAVIPGTGISLFLTPGALLFPAVGFFLAGTYGFVSKN